MFVCDAANFDRRHARLGRDLRAALPGNEPATGVDPVAEGPLALRAERLDRVVRVAVGDDEHVDARQPGLDVAVVDERRTSRSQTLSNSQRVWPVDSKPRVLRDLPHGDGRLRHVRPGRLGERRDDRRGRAHVLTGPAAVEVHEERVAPGRDVVGDVERDPRLLVEHRLDPVLLGLGERDPVRARRAASWHAPGRRTGGSWPRRAGR